MTPVSLRVRVLRLQRGWTQKELAERAGLPRLTVVRIENQQTKGVDFATLDALSRALGCHPGHLIARDDD